LALGAYLYSAISVIWIFFTGHLAYTPLLFHWSVLILAAWTAFRWWRLRSDSLR